MPRDARRIGYNDFLLGTLEIRFGILYRQREWALSTVNVTNGDFGTALNCYGVAGGLGRVRGELS